MKERVLCVLCFLVSGAFLLAYKVHWMGRIDTGIHRFVVHCGPTVYSDLSGTNFYDVRADRRGWYQAGQDWVWLGSGDRRVITNQ